MSGSFKTDILPLFRKKDIDCMTPLKVYLDSYEWMSKVENAQNVYDHLTGTKKPRMPAGGPFWPPDKLKKFNDWMTVDPKFQP